MIDFGSTIKQFRIKEKISQKELAKQAGITPSYLSSLEKGKNAPSITLLKKISAVLNVPCEIVLWESVEINNELSEEDKKTVELAKLIVRHYLESRYAHNVD